MKAANYQRIHINWPHSYKILPVVILQGMVVARGWRKGRVFNGDSISVLQDQKSFWNWMHSSVNYLTLLNCTIKMVKMAYSLLHINIRKHFKATKLWLTFVLEKIMIMYMIQINVCFSVSTFRTRHKGEDRAEKHISGKDNWLFLQLTWGLVPSIYVSAHNHP